MKQIKTKKEKKGKIRNEFYYAYDKSIRKSVIHVRIKDYLISLVTGRKKKYKKSDLK